MNNKVAYIIATASLLVGGIGSIAFQTFAQDIATTQTPTGQTQTTNTIAKTNLGHRPLGGDGIVLSISGATLIMAEESDEGGGSYTVDASTATITTNRVSVNLSDIKVGDKIFVEGTVSGTTVKANSISLGHPEFHKEKEGEADNDTETNDDEPGATN